MIQNKLKEAYPTPLQLRNATKELQNNMEISNEVYIDFNWDFSKDYTSPDKSIVYTVSNKTITFNMDIGFKLNCLNYVYFNNRKTLGVIDITIEFYSKNNSYSFYCLFYTDNEKLITTFKLVQKDGKSYYIFDLNTETDVASFTSGYIEFDTEFINKEILIKNLCLGKIKKYPLMGNYDYVYINEITTSRFSSQK